MKLDLCIFIAIVASIDAFSIPPPIFSSARALSSLAWSAASSVDSRQFRRSRDLSSSAQTDASSVVPTPLQSLDVKEKAKIFGRMADKYILLDESGGDCCYSGCKDCEYRDEVRILCHIIASAASAASVASAAFVAFVASIALRIIALAHTHRSFLTCSLRLPLPHRTAPTKWQKCSPPVPNGSFPTSAAASVPPPASKIIHLNGCRLSSPLPPN